MRKEGSTSEASSQKPTMDRILSEMNELRKEMLRLPELCAQRMIEKLNKTGVFYKPSNLEEDEENLYGGINESSNDGGLPKKEFVYQKDDSDRFRTPSKMNLQKDDDGVDVTSRGNTPFYCTPEYWDSFKGDMDDPIQVPEVSDEKAATSLGTDEIASHASLGSQGVQEEVDEVINAYSSYLVDKVNDDRFMLTTWRIHWLLHIRPGKKTAGNDYEAESHSNGPVNRCEDEYFKKSKTYIPLNKENTHWVTVVMHSGKREFQVLDSLTTGKLDSVTRELVEDLIFNLRKLYALGIRVEYFSFDAFNIGMVTNGQAYFHRGQLMIQER
ncbi:uncharacterized protein [Aegilops tauschii subsp. strangulata]|uniref:uncharacterized protein n=1 Tax=Aegilops tauschii subsp. strangulata TaxID=200361 RepID=UPI003CC8453F